MDQPPQKQNPRRDNERPKPPIGDIRMIVGGTTTTGSSKKAHKTYLRIVQNVQLTSYVLKIARRESPIIEFSEDTKDVTFLVVDCLSAYNAILGRPTLNLWKAVTSTYHLMIKFPTDYGVGELQGNQVAARKCYMAMMEMDDHLQAMSIEEH